MDGHWTQILGTAAGALSSEQGVPDEKAPQKHSQVPRPEMAGGLCLTSDTLQNPPVLGQESYL